MKALTESLLAYDQEDFKVYLINKRKLKLALGPWALSFQTGQNWPDDVTDQNFLWARGLVGW